MFIGSGGLSWAPGRIRSQSTWLKLRQLMAYIALGTAWIIYSLGIAVLILLYSGPQANSPSQVSCWIVFVWWTLLLMFVLSCYFWRSTTLILLLGKEARQVRVKTKTMFWDHESEYQIPNEATLACLSALTYQMPSGKKFRLTNELKAFLPGANESKRLKEILEKAKVDEEERKYEFQFDGGRQFAENYRRKILTFLILTGAIIAWIL